MDEEILFISDAAFAAVQRNGLASDAPPLRLVPDRKRTRVVEEPPKIADASRAEYDFEFRELVFKRLDAGMPERCGSKSVMPDCCAHHSALLELGCLEVWDFINGHLYEDKRMVA